MKKQKSNKNVYCQDFKAYLFLLLCASPFFPIFGPQLSPQKLKKIQITDFSEKAP